MVKEFTIKLHLFGIRTLHVRDIVAVCQGLTPVGFPEISF